MTSEALLNQRCQAVSAECRPTIRLTASPEADNFLLLYQI